MSRSLRILIASGPTEEPLDPVRYLTNRSTGYMGECLAAAGKKKGHVISWIRCPKDARTARDLRVKLHKLLPANDVLIMAAAVCDVRPAAYSTNKMKKGDLKIVRLIKNPDILQSLAKKRRADQIFIGFGLESSKLLMYGKEKIEKKSLDAIVLQEVKENKDPFGNKKIKAYILKKNQAIEKFNLVNKHILAEKIVKMAEKLHMEKKQRD